MKIFETIFNKTRIKRLETENQALRQLLESTIIRVKELEKERTNNSKKGNVKNE